MEDPRTEVENGARARHGVVSRREALSAGMTAAQIDRRLRRRQWVRSPGAGMYLLAEYEARPVSRAASAATMSDAVAWAGTALALWGVESFPQVPVVATPIQQHAPAGMRVCLVAGLGALPQTIREGVRCASLELAVASMTGERSERNMHDLVDRVIRERWTTWDRIADVFRLYGRRGREGSATITRLLEERSGEGPVPLSIWSRDVKKMLVDAGFVAPEMEWRVCSATGALIAQVDLAYPEARYAIELDSVAFHLNREAFIEDRRRDSALARVGWLCRRFTWEQFRNEPELVIATIRADLASRRSLP